MLAPLLLTVGISYAVGKDPRAVAMIDVNGGGKLDIVTANAGSRDASVLFGEGGGDFRSGPSSPATLEPAWMAGRHGQLGRK